MPDQWYRNLARTADGRVIVDIISNAGWFAVTFLAQRGLDHVQFEADGEDFEAPWSGWAGWFGSSVSVAWVCNNAESVGAMVVRDVELWDGEDDALIPWANLGRVVVSAIVEYVE